MIELSECPNCASDDQVTIAGKIFCMRCGTPAEDNAMIADATAAAPTDSPPAEIPAPPKPPEIISHPSVSKYSDQNVAQPQLVPNSEAPTDAESSTQPAQEPVITPAIQPTPELSPNQSSPSTPTLPATPSNGTAMEAAQIDAEIASLSAPAPAPAPVPAPVPAPAPAPAVTPNMSTLPPAQPMPPAVLTPNTAADDITTPTIPAFPSVPATPAFAVAAPQPILDLNTATQYTPAPNTTPNPMPPQPGILFPSEPVAPPASNIMPSQASTVDPISLKADPGGFTDAELDALTTPDSNQTIAPPLAQPAVPGLAPIAAPAIATAGIFAESPANPAPELLTQQNPGVDTMAQASTPDTSDTVIAPPEKLNQDKYQQFKDLKSSKLAKPAGIAVSVLALFLTGAYLWQSNYSNLAFKIASAKAGVSASVPGYIPAGYNLGGDIQTNPGTVNYNLVNNNQNKRISITQSKTDWDSQALAESYVAPKAENYLAVQAKGLTIYMLGNNQATWVNKGTWYKIESLNQAISQEQAVKIAGSL